jgi:hypothetical protein
MGKIHELLRNAKAEIGAIPKAHKNSGVGAGYSFRSVEDALNLAGPILRKHGITCVPRVVKHDTRTSPGTDKFGKPRNEQQSAVLMEMDFIADDDSQVTVSMAGEGIDFNGDKATSKSLSQAFKYCIFLGLQVPVEIGDLIDGDRDQPKEPQRRENYAPGSDVDPQARALSVIRNAFTEADLAKFDRLIDQRVENGEFTADQATTLRTAIEARRNELRSKTSTRETLAKNLARLGCPADRVQSWIDTAQIQPDAMGFIAGRPWEAEQVESIVAELKAASTDRFKVDEIYDLHCGPNGTLSEWAAGVVAANYKTIKAAFAAPPVTGKKKQSSLIETHANAGQ